MCERQQADLVLQCIRSIMTGAARINNNAVESLLGCFDLGKLVPLLKQRDNGAADSGKGVSAAVALKSIHSVDASSSWQ